MTTGSVAITAGSGTPIRIVTNAGVDSGADQQVMTLADSAGNLLGTAAAPVPAKLGDGTNSPAVKAASTAAAATDPSLVVALHPTSPLPAGTNTLGITALPASTLVVTATGAANAIVTATLSAAGAGLFHYITSVTIQRFMTAAGTGAGTAILTSGANHSLVWNQPSDVATIGTVSTVVDYRPTTPLRSTTANTNTTFITAAVTSTIYRINVTYYTGT